MYPPTVSPRARDCALISAIAEGEMPRTLSVSWRGLACSGFGMHVCYNRIQWLGKRRVEMRQCREEASR